MGKGILCVDVSILPELFHFPKELEEKVKFLGERHNQFRAIDLVVESELIPETPKDCVLPIVMPILFSLHPNGDGLVTEVKLFKLQVYGVFENGVGETITVYENEEIKELIERKRPTTA